MTSTAIRGRLGKNVGLLGRLIGAADVLVASPEPRQAEPGRMDPFGVDGGHLGLGIRGKSGREWTGGFRPLWMTRYPPVPARGDRTLIVGEQPELVHPGDRRSAGGDAELPIDRDRLCLHGVPCDVEPLADLAEGEMGGQ